ncbi:Insulin receptor [Lamellibrachia satsuma]|nr:Insulin receptor [Lamellibrachia satsuma]
MRVCPVECRSRPCYTIGSEVHCCHAQCLGGCRGPDVTDCDACVSVFYTGRCLRNCPHGTYELMGRRCILEEECRNMTQGYPVVQNNWKLLNNKCVLGCPSGYIPSKADKHKCDKCAGKCPKICDGMVIDNVAAAQKLKGCVVINGILEIQIRGGSHVGRELEENLGMIEEVTNYVKIVRSYAIVSLRFLMNLRVIHGKQLYNDRYALFVLDNQNLQEVWDVTKHPNLTVENGHVFFHHNRKLCLNKIEEFIHAIGLENVTGEKDVSPTTNGDQVAYMKLLEKTAPEVHVEFVDGNSDAK